MWAGCMFCSSPSGKDVVARSRKPQSSFLFPAFLLYSHLKWSVIPLAIYYVSDYFLFIGFNCFSPTFSFSDFSGFN